jgi:hypothetical protein
MELLRPFSGGLKIRWWYKGHGNYWRDEFSFKVYTALNGGVDKVIGTMYEKSSNLDKSLDYEINTSVKVNGLVKKPQTFI